jgi:hypothetical protein
MKVNREDHTDHDVGQIEDDEEEARPIGYIRPL